ncbi:synaptosomal-associated 29 [Brachionus plicatilis]|uniref:Synaptosomal-associated 29 n=1 Tax=Brachionus plicatilis TaxID=10195 RepID=A0A3M7SUK4_BRAPC|nr:synaptosomal-associated 29 [Brachionus plicatilis]
MSLNSKNPFETNDDDYKFGNRNRPEDDDIRFIQEKIGKVENDSLESTTRALRVLNETQEIGAKTAVELHRQGEQLSRVDERLDDVNNTLNSTQKNLNQVKSVFGGLKNKFFGWSSKNVSTESKKSEIKRDAVSVNNLQSFNKPKAELVQITGSDREKEIHKNLDEMSSGLKRLAAMGLEMQFELDKQNNMIDGITNKSIKTDERINDQNAQMRRILK